MTDVRKCALFVPNTDTTDDCVRIRAQKASFISREASLLNVHLSNHFDSEGN